MEQRSVKFTKAATQDEEDSPLVGNGSSSPALANDVDSSDYESSSGGGSFGRYFVIGAIAAGAFVAVIALISNFTDRATVSDTHLQRSQDYDAYGLDATAKKKGGESAGRHHHHNNNGGGGGGGAGAKCQVFGCGSGFDRSRPCQCNSDCQKYNSCCYDYQALCGDSTPAPWSPPAPPPPPAVRPPGGAGHGTTPVYRSANRGVMQGIAYGPSPEMKRGVLLPNDDFMSEQGAMLWAPWGRGDLATMRALGANTVRLYGNDPSQSHTAFLDEADKNGLGVIAGMSDWPFLQMPGNCQTTGYDCFTQIYESYKQNLVNGFVVDSGGGSKAYHPALRAMIVINEPEIGKFNKDKKVQCKVVASAMDAMLSAERDAGIRSNLIAFTVTYSYASFYGPSAIGQMEMLYNCMKDPRRQGGYTPKNDVTSAYLSRFVNAFNTYSPADAIRGQFLANYARSSFWQGSTQIPVFVGEYHAPSTSQSRDLPNMLGSAKDGRYPFFLGFSFFEFQARYDKAHNAEHEMTFGMFGFDSNCNMGQMDFFGQSYPIHSLVARKDNTGTPMASALASAYGGDASKIDYRCKKIQKPITFQPQPESYAMDSDLKGSMSLPRNISAWDDNTGVALDSEAFSDVFGARSRTTEYTQSGPYSCSSNLDLGSVVLPERKGIALDDTTFENCADQVPYLWPNTNQKLLSVRLFKAWGMTDPKFFHTDMMKAWAGLKTYAQATGGKFLLGVSVTCRMENDEKEWEAGRRFIEYVGHEHFMGLAVGNEIDLQVGAANGPCLHNLWQKDGYLKTLIKRVKEFDAIPGMSSLPITAVLSNNAMGGTPFTSKVTKFLKGAWEHFGTRFVFSINVYPQFSGGLRQAGCHGAADVGTKFSMDKPSGFTPSVVKELRKKMDSMGQQDKKIWLGETGWATHAYCVLGCEEACRSKRTHRRYYENFLKWDLTAGDATEADHVFYFTLRDSSVFGKREEFGLISSCGSKHCKIQK